MWNSPGSLQTVKPKSNQETRQEPEDVINGDNRNQIEELVAVETDCFSIALDAARMGVWDWDLRTGKMIWSAWHYALFGLDIQQATGEYQEFAERIYEEDRAGLQEAVQRAKDTGAEYRHEYRVIWPDGTQHWVAGQGRFFYDAQGNAKRMAGVLMDATERHELRQQMETQMAQVQAAYCELEANRGQLEAANVRLAEANERLEQLAMTDELTGLKNKRAFTTFLEQEFQEAVRYHRPLSVILLDADHFKQINDRCGHPAGDSVLRCMGKLLQAQKRQIDMAARFGGEEFVFVLPDTDQTGATAAAERIRIVLENFPWDEHPVTASFGVATGITAQSDPADLIVQADRALYQSKRNGRNRVTHFADLPHSEDSLYDLENTAEP